MNGGRFLRQNRDQGTVTPVKLDGFKQTHGTPFVHDGFDGLNHVRRILPGGSLTSAEILAGGCPLLQQPASPPLTTVFAIPNPYRPFSSHFSPKNPASTILPGQRLLGGVVRSTIAQSGSLGVWRALFR